jgi:aromatic-L-amino-acid/L-tryptophan decarboxylase
MLVAATLRPVRDYHMSSDEFRRHGHQLVDWIAEYLDRVEELPVLSQARPGDVRARLPEHPPDAPEPFDRVLADIDEIILPGITHWQSPNFFAYFPANASGPSILGELLSAGLGVQGMLWTTSPAATELETHVLDWLADLLDLPPRFRSVGAGGGVIQDSASSAVLCALVAARERAGHVRPAVYASTEAHSSVAKAVRIAGLGAAALREVPVDGRGAMRAADLAATVESDIAAGFCPLLAVATVGTTGSAAIDPVAVIGEICRRHGIWLHVDAAMAGTAALVPELRYVNDGLELADSYCTNPHKWMFTNFDCDAFYVADRQPLIEALSVLPEYLRNAATDSGEVIDYRDWQIPLGRRFRALKLWFVIRHYGVEGLRHHVRRHVELARQFAEWVIADDRFVLANPGSRLNLVCLRHRDGDNATRRVLEAVNASGRAYLTHTTMDGRLVIRVSVGQTRTEHRHVERLWHRLQTVAG